MVGNCVSHIKGRDSNTPPGLKTSGKVQKFVLREQAIKTLGLEEGAKTKIALH